MINKSDVFDNLDERETAYVLARSDSFSNNQALRKCGFSFGWLRNKDIEDLNARADSLRKDKAIRASMILSEAVEEAALVKTAGLKARDERIKQAVATEIIDRELGKVPNRTELTGADNAPIELVVTYADKKQSTDEEV